MKGQKVNKIYSISAPILTHILNRNQKQELSILPKEINIY